MKNTYGNSFNFYDCYKTLYITIIKILYLKKEANNIFHFSSLLMIKSHYKKKSYYNHNEKCYINNNM